MDNIIEPELLDGSNCTIGGDMLCDTPADPNLSLPDMVAPPCMYVGTITDANGDLYMPMLNNLMSYSPCTADSLTTQQGALMRFMVDSIFLHLRRTSAPSPLHHSTFGNAIMPVRYNWLQHQVPARSSDHSWMAAP